MKWFLYIVVAVIGLFFAVLGLFNSEDVTFNYVFNSRVLPLIVVMLISFIFGAFLALVVFGSRAFYWRRRAKNAEKQIGKINLAADKAQKQKEFEAVRKTS